MKLMLLAVMGLIFAHLMSAQNLNPTDEQSSVKFQIKNFGFNVAGSFKGLKGDIKFDPNDPENTQFEVSIDASTINTGIDMRDEHLRSDAYFDVKNYPRISFSSTGVTRSNRAGTFFVSGKLTIKNTTKDIVFPFTASPQEDGYLFTGEFKLNRKDFGVGGSGTISNELVVNLAVVAKK